MTKAGIEELYTYVGETTGAAGGFLAGAEISSYCGPFAIECGAVLAPGGAVVGSVSGLTSGTLYGQQVTSDSSDEIKADLDWIEDKLSGMISGLPATSFGGS